ncbi:SH3 domain-containing protein [Vibrio sp. B1Z05]|uniref:SH3 domain-containing protein n=1 Tax=Vibrio sp. B1Z05 TaxID=2654980 RepID=UPI00128E6B31|nr:SH3 domain-containing protein [Vibrio sp. B1Z05]MPW36557.1 SH3 domain-containing protein [Vibrio sp. B1Z05]
MDCDSESSFIGDLLGMALFGFMFYALYKIVVLCFKALGWLLVAIYKIFDFCVLVIALFISRSEREDLWFHHTGLRALITIPLILFSCVLVMNDSNEQAYIARNDLVRSAIARQSQAEPTQAQTKQVATKPQTVNTQLLNIRSNPNAKAGVVAQLGQDSIVLVNKTQGSWSEISYNETRGWVASRYLTVAENPIYAHVTAIKLNVRNAPPTGAVLFQLNKGDKVTIDSSRNNWVKIKYKDKSGWVAQRFLDLT